MDLILLPVANGAILRLEHGGHWATYDLTLDQARALAAMATDAAKGSPMASTGAAMVAAFQADA